MWHRGYLYVIAYFLMCYFICMRIIFNDECLQTQNSWNNLLLKTLKMLVTHELQLKLEIKFKHTFEFTHSWYNPVQVHTSRLLISLDTEIAVQRWIASHTPPTLFFLLCKTIHQYRCRPGKHLTVPQKSATLPTASA